MGELGGAGNQGKEDRPVVVNPEEAGEDLRNKEEEEGRRYGQCGGE